MIVVDLTYVNEFQTTGVSTYAIRLIKGLILYGKEVSIIGCEDNIAFLKRLFPSCIIHKGRNVLSLTPLRYFFLYYICRRNIENILKDDDVYLIPFLTIWSIISTKKCCVGVLHDIQTLSQNKGIKRFIYRWILRNNLCKLHRIITISDFSMNQIRVMFPETSNKLKRIYNSIERIDNEVRNSPVVKGKYILDVNAMMEYKNHITLIKAFEHIMNDIPHYLIIKSKINSYWNNVLFPYIKEHHLEDRVLLIDRNLTSEEISSLYYYADLFVSTSLMEGFGFTPIEAAINKVPVLTTKCDALYETTMGILNYIDDPYDFEEIALKMKHLLNNRMTTQELCRISDLFNERYSLQKQAQNYVNFFASFR